MKIFLYLLSVLVLVLSLFAIVGLIVLLMFGVDLVYVLPVIVVMGAVLLSTFVMMWKIYKINRDRMNTVAEIDYLSLISRVEILFYAGLGMIALAVGFAVSVLLKPYIFNNTVHFLKTILPFPEDTIEILVALTPVALALSGYYLTFFYGLKLLKFRRP